MGTKPRPLLTDPFILQITSQLRESRTLVREVIRNRKETQNWKTRVEENERETFGWCCQNCNLRVGGTFWADNFSLKIS